jgi:hypothetical protein
MATATRNLFVNNQTKILQFSDKNGAVVTLPAFNKYEAIPFKIVIVEEDTQSAGLLKFSRVDISNLSMSVSLNDTYDDAAPLAYQNTFSKDEDQNVFSGTLNLNTAALNSWLSTTESKSAYFEIEIQEGSNVSKLYVATVTVKQSVAQVGATVPSPVDEYYTKAQADQQFLKPISPAGVQHTITSPGGTYVRIIGVDDGGNAIDQILPA